MTLFSYRTRRKMELASNLMDFTNEQIDACRVPESGDVKHHDERYILNRPQIRADFRYRRFTSSY